MLYFSAEKYFLTEFSSDWAKEVQMSTQELQFGKKILDTKLGSRAAMFVQPFFELGFDRPANEHQEMCCWELSVGPEISALRLKSITKVI